MERKNVALVYRLVVKMNEQMFLTYHLCVYGHYTSVAVALL